MPHSKARTSRIENVDGLIQLIHDSNKHFIENASVSCTGVLFVGGEPTIHPKFKYILSEIQIIRQRTPTFEIEVVSNMSRTKEWWSGVAPLLTTIVASYHDEHVHPTVFADKIVHCMNENPELQVTVGMQPKPGSIVKSRSDAELIRNIVSNRIKHAKKRLDFIFQHLYVEDDVMYPYTPEELQFFNQCVEDMSNDQINNTQRLSHQAEFLEHSITKSGQYYGHNCYAGVESIVVGFNGKIKRTARCSVSDGNLGSLDKGYVLPTKPVICDVRTGCGNCYYDYAVRKTDETIIYKG